MSNDGSFFGTQLWGGGLPKDSLISVHLRSSPPLTSGNSAANSVEICYLHFAGSKRPPSFDT